MTGIGDEQVRRLVPVKDALVRPDPSMVGAPVIGAAVLGALESDLLYTPQGFV